MSNNQASLTYMIEKFVRDMYSELNGINLFVKDYKWMNDDRNELKNRNKSKVVSCFYKIYDYKNLSIPVTGVDFIQNSQCKVNFTFFYGEGYSKFDVFSWDKHFKERYNKIAGVTYKNTSLYRKKIINQPFLTKSFFGAGNNNFSIDILFSLCYNVVNDADLGYEVKINNTQV